MSSAPPGYYINPDDPNQERWWDGTKWLDQTRPAQGNPALPGQPTVPLGGVPTPPQQGTRNCPDCGGMVSVNASTCVHCGAPLAPTYVSQAPSAARSGYYTAAWVCLLFCFPLTIVFNLMDNSVSKAKGLPPRYGPMITAIILWALFAFIYVAAASSSTTTY